MKYFVHFCQPVTNRIRRTGILCAMTLTLSGLFALGEEPGTKQTVPDANQESPPTVDKDHAAKMAQGVSVFKKHVRPVLLAQCVKCHGGQTVESEFDLTDREKLLRGGASGKVVEPGRAKSGALYDRITHARKPGMPFKGEKLPDETIARIAEWIELGAPYDAPLTTNRDQSSWTEKIVDPEARAFWAFQLLNRREPPTAKEAGLARTPIDRFVLEKLEAKGLSLNAPADKVHLIRRAYFDLIGLPPPPEAVAAFLNDASSDAWGNLLDQLLVSPQYGERWARHWLDIARFAESHGFEHDYDRPTAYHFRDFVIQALNLDLPFDTFVKWQVAGDEYEPDNNLALMATGFLAAGVHSTQITKNEVEKHRYDEMDDMLATTGSAMLGLSIGCARCHDHKFDPIPQRDYYRLLSTFTTTVRSELELNLDAAGYERAKAAFDVEHAPFAAALQKFEAEQLPGRLAAWEKEGGVAAQSAPWVVLDPQTLKSEGGATLTKLADGSILATGTNPQYDTYTFVVPTNLTGITAIRVEALADPSLVKGGPGRSPNSNFDLTDFRVMIAPKQNNQASGGRAPTDGLVPPGAVPVRMLLKNPRATFEQAGLPITAAIDDNEKSGWAVDPQFGKDHAAAFDLDAPAGFEGGSILTFTLVFKGNDKHNFGRTRLAVSTAKQPVELNARGIPQPILESLAASSEARTAEQQTALLKWYATQDAEWQKLNLAAGEHLAKAPKPNIVKAMISSEGLAPVRLHSQGGDFLEQTHFLRRGDPNQKDSVAPQGFLQVLMPGPDAAKQWQSPPPAGWRTSYRRRALAEWLTDTRQGAGGLLARVIVNRLWQHHLGRGIVATPNDFGVRGSLPTHPELLDWLSAELIQRGWKLKEMHKLIMTSAVYMQSSRFDDAKSAIDRENELLWRRPPHRLEAEVIRDNLLAVSGLLDSTMFGPGTLDEASRRRSIYFTVKRSKLVPMMQVFDAPDALSSLGERSSTTVAPQALLLMNNPNTRLYARAFAKGIAGDPAIDLTKSLRAGYVMAVARQPTDEELADGAAFVAAQAASYQAAGKPDARELALADFCQVLLCLNEFVYVE